VVCEVLRCHVQTLTYLFGAEKTFLAMFCICLKDNCENILKIDA